VALYEKWRNNGSMQRKVRNGLAVNGLYNIGSGNIGSGKVRHFSDMMKSALNTYNKSVEEDHRLGSADRIERYSDSNWALSAVPPHQEKHYQCYTQANVSHLCFELPTFNSGYFDGGVIDYARINSTGILILSRTG